MLDPQSDFVSRCWNTCTAILRSPPELLAKKNKSRWRFPPPLWKNMLVKAFSCCPHFMSENANKKWLETYNTISKLNHGHIIIPFLVLLVVMRPEKNHQPFENYYLLICARVQTCPNSFFGGMVIPTYITGILVNG